MIDAEVIGLQRNSNLAELLGNMEGIDIGDGVGMTGGPPTDDLQRIRPIRC